MKKIINAYTILVTAVLTIAALLVNIFLFNKNPEIVIEKSNIQLIPFFCYLFVFGFHVISLFYLIQTFKNQSGYREFKILVLVVFVFSVISFLIDKVMIDELADELSYGFDLSLIMITIPLLFKILYASLILILVFLDLTDKRKLEADEKKDQAIFTLAQIVGIVTGITGLLFVIIQIINSKGNPLSWLPAFLIFLVPYGLIVMYWILLKLKEKLNDWYDEKQWKDVLKSALVTMILSIPGMGLMFLFKKPLEYFWFPYYIFFILFIFSATTLLLYKKT